MTNSNIKQSRKRNNKSRKQPAKRTRRIREELIWPSARALKLAARKKNVKLWKNLHKLHKNQNNFGINPDDSLTSSDIKKMEQQRLKILLLNTDE